MMTGPSDTPYFVRRGPTRMISLLALMTATLAAATHARAAVRLASVFGDHMVVQRDRPVPVWGTADAGTRVDIEFAGHRATAIADASGRWTAELPPGPAGGPFELVARSGNDAITVRDVLCGDVWLCGGQSNMQMSLGEADHGPATAKAAGALTTLRLCKVGHAWTDTPQTTADVKWTPSTPDTAAKFSAAGYFFGSDLAQSRPLKGVPVGLIECDLGGTMAEAWAPEGELGDIPKIDRKDSMFGIKPTSLYNGMVAPLGPVGLRGVLWYQGEGNAGDPTTYPAKLSAVIRGWRAQFKNAELPFLIVQLPDFVGPWGDVYWQWQRDAQRQVSDRMPHVGLVNALNTNDGTDLHPKPKQAIGQRAALLARQTVYGEAVVGRGPVFESADMRGDGVHVTFKTDGSTLAAADPADVRGFLLAGDDGKYRVARGRLDGDRAVVVTSDLVPDPKTVRFAWAGVPNATLTNKQGLPAYAFRTDTLPIDTVGVRPPLPGRVVGNKNCELTITGDRVTGFVVHNQQLLSNETGNKSGVLMPGFLGPRGFGPLAELGPDLVRLGDDRFSLTIGLDDDACVWTIKSGSDKKEGETVRINLSPLLNVSPLKDGAVRLSALPGKHLTLRVTGITKVDTDNGVRFLEARVDPKQTVVVRFGDFQEGTAD